MKCLSVAQPYADLILLPDGDAKAKRVENRNWPTDHRGLTLIHASRSLAWLGLSRVEARRTFPDMVFGAILGAVEVIDCVRAEDILRGRKYPELQRSRHVGGPWCFVLKSPVRFAEPVYYKGSLGFFTVPDDVVKESAMLEKIRICGNK